MWKRLLYLTPLLLLAACSDDPTGARPRPDGTARFTHSHVPSCQPAAIRTERITVTDAGYGAVADDGVDDSDAIQKALYEAREVVIPAGTFNVSKTLCIPSNTKVTGAGSGSSTLAQAVEAHVFGSAGSYDPNTDVLVYVEDITVSGIGFKFADTTTADNAYQRMAKSALAVVMARNVHFHGNKTRVMGLFRAEVRYPVDHKRAKNPLNYDIHVHDNQTVGVHDVKNPLPPPPNDDRKADAADAHAVLLMFTRDAHVYKNDIEKHNHGVTAWGGNANSEGDPAHPRLVSYLRLHDNRIVNTIGGVFFSMVDSATVRGNQVEMCHDMCLDAEGSTRVRFVRNTATTAGVAPLGVYFYANEVVFDSNTVKQTGELKLGTHNGQDQFAQSPGGYVADTIRLHGNTFEYTPVAGAGPVGRVPKSYSRRFTFTDNQLTNTVIDLGPDVNGLVQLTGNVLSFTRFTRGMPAIYVAKNDHNVGSFEGGYHAVVSGNRISTTAEQGFAPGIKVCQHLANTRITGNTVEGYYRSILVNAANSTSYFEVKNNRRTGEILRQFDYIFWDEADNSWISPASPRPEGDVLDAKDCHSSVPVFTGWSPASGSTVPKDPVVEFVIVNELGIDPATFTFTKDGQDWRSNAAAPTVSADGTTLRFWSNVTNLPEGQPFTLKARVCGTNYGCTERWATYTIQSPAPRFTYWSPATGSTLEPDPVVQFAVTDDVGIDAGSFVLAVNGTNWAGNYAPPTLSSDGKTLTFWSNVMQLPRGTFQMSAYVRNTRGTAKDTVLTYTIPGSNPQFTAWDPADGSTLGKDPAVTFTMTDDVGIDPNSFRFTMNGTDWRSNAAPPTLSSDGKTLHFWSNVMNLPTGQVTLRADFCSTSGACAWKQATYTIQY